MGLMVLRWGWGAQRFEDLARTIVKFLDYTKEGTKFVFGFVANPPNVCGMFPVFVFSVLQTLIYFGSIVAVLYYYGIIQFVLRQVATLVRATLTTTAAESLQACACVFLGMTEGPLLIQPYIDKMTASELHAILTSNFSCIAGTLFAAYISLGACPNYLLSSSIMSAPGSLACSKLLFPETEESHLKDIKDLELPRGSETTALECLSNGASATVQIVFSIGANLLVVIAFLAFFDDVIGYLGELVGIYGLSFQMLLGYLFFPLAYLMGVTDDLNETLQYFFFSFRCFSRNYLNFQCRSTHGHKNGSERVHRLPKTRGTHCVKFIDAEGSHDRHLRVMRVFELLRSRHAT
ncbi:hypothetical protein WR25_23015 isoform E [Diploscapter pachys]|uniref:Concentrative nucleoside transporter C-terminal domain-containing protein n=1 Tax=Diploscapter pachys TaxID=2018661 RepID=A0A2A2KYE7_9BILA|nr:hypothetical protein WR25_23015 isoform A [Diploscapter pachys]PAV79028.1 hypothetical protein WR25_23015 isoform C [Diploscapter pachys]PAV79030.1 hypothetical protein WR25_23015 isoform E [Diploscapter pachys]